MRLMHRAATDSVCSLPPSGTLWGRGGEGGSCCCTRCVNNHYPTPNPSHKGAAARSAGDWTLDHLRDRSALFHKLLHGFRFDLVARSRKVDIDLRKDSARGARQYDDPIG
jgi:hypothetical protein